MTPPDAPALAASAVHFGFDNTYARLPERFYARLDPTPVAAPRLIKLNVELARSLGLDPDALASAARRRDPGRQPRGRRVRASGAKPMPATSSATSCRSLATAAPTCWAKSWPATARATTSSSRAPAPRRSPAAATAVPRSAPSCASTSSAKPWPRSACPPPAPSPPSPPASA